MPVSVLRDTADAPIDRDSLPPQFKSELRGR